jgi:hypothetical protein
MAHTISTSPGLQWTPGPSRSTIFFYGLLCTSCLLEVTMTNLSFLEKRTESLEQKGGEIFCEEHNTFLGFFGNP